MNDEQETLLNTYLWSVFPNQTTTQILWMNTKNKSLGGITPKELCKTEEGAAKVLQYLACFIFG